MKAHRKITAQVIDKIIDSINKIEAGEQACAPWQRPWHQSGVPMNLEYQKPYRGINPLLLSFSGFSSPYWLTYKQAEKLGGNVKKGEKGTTIIFWAKKKTDEDKDGNKLDKPKTILLPVAHNVFNLEQCENIPENKIPKQEEKREFNPIENAQKILDNWENACPIRHGGNEAYYSPMYDKIQMPEPESFKTDAGYYAVLFHEAAHSTGHATRLNRKEVMDFNAFGSHDYSVEELVAEMTATMLVSITGIDYPIDNSLAYLKSWLRKLQENERWLITAGARAQKAVDHILNVKYENKENDKEEKEESQEKSKTKMATA